MARLAVRRHAGPVLLSLLVVLVSACDRPKHKVEVLEEKEERQVVKVASSDEAYVLFQRIAEVYSARHNVHFEVSQTHSGNLPELLGKKAVDIGVASRSVAPRGKAPGLNYIPIAFDGAVFLVSSEAKVRSLTTEQIRRIYSGEITNWKEVGGADAAIRVIARPPYSSVPMALGASIFGGEFPKAKSAFVLERAESAYHALKSLSSYIAIAPMSRTMVEEFPAVAVAVDGMQPLMSNVPHAKYPARIEYGMMFRKDAPEAVKDFANYIVSLEGMHQLASLGFAPSPANLSLSACHCRATEGTFVPSRKSELAGQLTIAVVPELGAVAQEKRYSGICREIAEEMGIKTRLKHMESYWRVIEEFAEGRIDAAFVGSLVYGHLHERFGVLPLARPEAGGVSFYRGLIIVRADGRLRRFSELRGKSLAWVPNTSAGELFPLSLIGEGEGERLKRYFSRLERVSSHSDAVHYVLSGKVDAAAVKDLVLLRMAAASPDLKGKLQVIASSCPFPENALVASPLMDEGQRRRLAGILIGLNGTERGMMALDAMGADRFIPTSHGEYSEMFSMARSTGFRFGKK